MPRVVRNFFIDLTIDGKKQRIRTGPRGGSGGFDMVITMREQGQVSTQALHVIGRCEDGVLVLKAYDTSDNEIKLETQV